MVGIGFDYFLMLVQQSKFLSKSIQEKDLFEWMGRHLSDGPDIMRGILDRL